MNDRIKVNRLHFFTPIFGSPWPTIDDYDPQHAGLQPVMVTVEGHLNLQDAGQLDNLSHSVDYSQLSRKVRDGCCLFGPDGPMPVTPYDLAERILEFCLKDIRQQIRQFDVELEFPKLVLRAKSAGVKLSWRRDDQSSKKHNFSISELPVHTIVGLRPHERKDKQPVIISLQLDSATTGHKDLHFDFSSLERRISDFVEASAYMTIEALTVQITRECFAWLEYPAQYTVVVSVAKPAAITAAQAPEIRVTRKLLDFPSLMIQPSREGTSGRMFAALSLGANLGDRFQNIELALRYLENVQTLWMPDLPSCELQVIDTSFLYESAPMYVESQPAFINCACLVETTFSPQDLLRICKHIEKTVGRAPSERFGPRAVDLDIITFGDQTVDTRAPEYCSSLDCLEGQLVIPHPCMVEREFVLSPLKDIIPEWVHPQLHLSTRSLLAKLMLGQESTLDRVIPFPFSPELRSPGEHKTPATQTYWVLPNPNATSPSERRRLERRYTMATLNVTPDSFSDGGEHNALVSALAYAREAVAAGADIIDIGGYSTRPGATDISPSEEIARVVPVIHAIRADSDERLRSIPISIDTFRADVARAALDAGANCINDVYAFSGGPEYYHSVSSFEPRPESDACFAEMQTLARERGVPVVMMHSRGPADQNKDYSAYNTFGADRNVIEGVRFELASKVVRATRDSGALRRWQVIVDPGVGFGKDVDGNLQVLRKAGSLTAEEFLPPGAASFYSAPGSRSPGSSLRNENNSSRLNLHSHPYETPNWNPLAGYPLLIGASRKSFLGALISAPLLPPHPSSSTSSSSTSSDNKDLPPKERDFATAATVTCAVQQGAAIVRVHAVREMVDVVKVAAALCARE